MQLRNNLPTCIFYLSELWGFLPLTGSASRYLGLHGITLRDLSILSVGLNQKHLEVRRQGLSETDADVLGRYDACHLALSVLPRAPCRVNSVILWALIGTNHNDPP